MPQSKVALDIELFVPVRSSGVPELNPGQKLPPVIVSRPEIVPPFDTRSVPLVIRSTVLHDSVATVRSPAVLVYTTSAGPDPMTTSSAAAGMPSGLQFAASCQLVVPAPPSQVFSTARADAPMPRTDIRPRTARKAGDCITSVWRVERVFMVSGILRTPCIVRLVTPLDAGT